MSETDDVEWLFDQVPTYSTAEVARLCGLSPMTLHRLASAGVISSSTPAAGTGSRRRWSSAEVDRLCRIAEVNRTAHDAGLLLTWQAIAQMWNRLEAGQAWELSLTA